MSNENKALKAIADWNKAQITLLEAASMLDSCNPDVLLGKIEVLTSLGDLLVEVTRPEDQVTDDEIVDQMKKTGGRFIRVLTDLFRVADPDNRSAIRKTWAYQWEQYRNQAIAARVPHSEKYIGYCEKCGGEGTEKRVMDMDFKVCGDCKHQWKD